MKDKDIPPVALPVQGEEKLMSQITDEDSLKVAKIFHSDYDWAITSKEDIVVILECRDYRIYIWLVEEDFIDFEERYVGKENIEAHGGESESCSPYRSIIDIIDYLRFKGYKLPNKYATTHSTDAVAFLDSIRDYERENKNPIYLDERTSDELYNIFKQQNSKV